MGFSEKEKQLLETEVRSLRLRKSGIEKEIDGLLKEKVSITEGIEILKRQRSDHSLLADKAKEAHREAQAELSEIKEKAKVIEERQAARDAGLDKRAAQLEAISEEREKAAKELSNDRLRLKEEKRAHIAEVAKLDQRAAKVVEDEKRLVHEWGLIKQEQEKNKSLQASIQSDKDAAFDTLKKANEVLNKAKEKEAQADERLKEAAARKEQVAKEEADLFLKTEINEKEKEENLTEKARLDTQRNEIQVRSNALDIKEKEAEIRRLRMEKLIKEKGIGEELTKLEAELKK